MAFTPRAAPPADPGRGKRSAAVAVLALFALGAVTGSGQDVETSDAAGRLRSLLDAWLVELTAARRLEAWQEGDAIARRIADDRELDNALLEAEKVRILEETLALVSRIEDPDEQQNQADAYNHLWQTLENSLVLRLEARRAMSADATALRPRLDRWRAETAGAPNADDDHWHASASALARELAAGASTDADLSLELELARRSIRRLYGGPTRYYLSRTSLVGLLAEIEAMEQAVALRAPAQAMTPEVVVVHAEILAYEIMAAREWFEDGWEAIYDTPERLYDMTVMRVLSPAEYVDRGDLRFMHDGPPARDSQWRQVGQGFRFEIAREHLDRAFDEKNSLWLFPSFLENGGLLQAADAK